MHETCLYEYAIIRLVPKVEREEFINLGVIIFCPRLDFLKCKYQLDIRRITEFAALAELSDLQAHLRAFELICLGDHAGGPIAALDMPSRFRWLTAIRSTIIQSSRVHPGYLTDPEETLKRLFSSLVLVTL